MKSRVCSARRSACVERALPCSRSSQLRSAALVLTMGFVARRVANRVSTLERLAGRCGLVDQVPESGSRRGLQPAVGIRVLRCPLSSLAVSARAAGQPTTTSSSGWRRMNRQRPTASSIWSRSAESLNEPTSETSSSCGSRRSTIAPTVRRRNSLRSRVAAVSSRRTRMVVSRSASRDAAALTGSPGCLGPSARHRPAKRMRNASSRVSARRPLGQAPRRAPAADGLRGGPELPSSHLASVLYLDYLPAGSGRQWSALHLEIRLTPSGHTTG